MALFNWKEEYSVKVKEIDKQHQMLVDSLNELHAAMLSGKSREILAGIIKSLVDYAGFHFSYEEEKMDTLNFPGSQAHKKEHEAFIKKVADFQEKQKEGKLMLSMEIMNFLKDWLVKHILGTDKKYSDFFNKNGLT